MITAAAPAKSLQSCLTLCDPIDGSPLGSSDPGILQARIPELGHRTWNLPSSESQSPSGSPIALFSGFKG